MLRVCGRAGVFPAKYMSECSWPFSVSCVVSEEQTLTFDVAKIARRVVRALSFRSMGM